METAKITKHTEMMFVKTQLASNPSWAKRALIKIYEFQTAEEQNSQRTKDYNGIGFTGVDGGILSSFAQQFLTKGYLSPKQMELVFRKMPKYWKQVIMISDPNALQRLIINTLN